MLLVGSDTVTIDSALCIRLPKAWTDHGEQDWLLLPQHLHRSHAMRSGWLVLLPVRSGAAFSLSRLQSSAFEFGQRRHLASLVRTAPRRRSIRITPAQLEWMDVVDHRLVVSGVLVLGQLCSSKRWSETVAAAGLSSR